MDSQPFDDPHEARQDFVHHGFLPGKTRQPSHMYFTSLLGQTATTLLDLELNSRYYLVWFRFTNDLNSKVSYASGDRLHADYATDEAR